MGKNHSGLSGPVPRGRKGKKGRSSSQVQENSIGWVSDEKFDMELHLDKGYRRHLDRHGTKLILRIRMLYYIQHDILVDYLKQIKTPGCAIASMPVFVPPCDGSPAIWWDAEADKSLLVGTYRHGFEHYQMMRLDPDLCFLSRCGPPNSEDLQEELKKDIEPDENSKLDADDDDSNSTKTPNESRASSVKPDEVENTTPGQLPFPSISDLNQRIRRLITAYQREFKKEEARQLAKDKRNERRERIEQVIREREQQKIDVEQKKWSRKEEINFLRTVLTFGVEYSRKEKRYVWDRFRQLSRLDRKFDDTLTEYLACFFASCKKSAGKKLSNDEELILQAAIATSPSNFDFLNEDRAKRILQRVEMLNKAREDIITHPDIEERIKKCDLEQDLPDWWVPGLHDRDLLFGAARHGLSRMEYYVLNDPDLCFKDLLKRHLGGESLVDKKAMAEFEKRMAGKKPAPSPAKEEKEEKKVEEEEEEKMEVDEKEEKADESTEEETKKESKKEKRKSKDRDEKKEKEKDEETFKETRSRRKSTKDSTEATKLAIEASKMMKAEAAAKSKKKDDKKEKEEKEKEKEATKKEETKNDEEKKEDDVKKEEKPVSKKKVSVSIPPPQISLEQMEQMAKGGLIYDMEMMNELMAQTYAAAIKWPKDKILEVRLRHIMTCVEKDEWPVDRDYALSDHLLKDDEDDEALFAAILAQAAANAASDTPARDTSTPMSESSEVSYDDPNVLTHGAGGKRSGSQRRGRRPLDYAAASGDDRSKIRSLLQQPTLSESDDAR